MLERVLGGFGWPLASQLRHCKRAEGHRDGPKGSRAPDVRDA